MVYFPSHTKENIKDYFNFKEIIMKFIGKNLEFIHNCPLQAFITALILSGKNFTNLKQYSLSKLFHLSQLAVNRSSVNGVFSQKIKKSSPGQVGRVFTNGPGSIPGRVIPETQKWYLILPCLTHSIIRCVSSVKWSNTEKRVASSPRCNS